MSKRKLEEKSASVSDCATKKAKVVEPIVITTPYDWVQLRVLCDDIAYIRRIIVVSAGITLYNLHRIIHYCAKYKDNLGFEHVFNIKNEKYGSGAGLEKGRTSDRKTRLLQLLSTTGEAFQYVYGQLKVTLLLEAIKNGEKQKMVWLPKLCLGSKGTFPAESSCDDLQQLQQYKPLKTIDIDKINKILMHESFGANQKTNKATKRAGPSILCKSNQPNSTIALIYKRPIEEVTDSESSVSSEGDGA